MSETPALPKPPAQALLDDLAAIREQVHRLQQAQETVLAQLTAFTLEPLHAELRSLRQGMPPPPPAPRHPRRVPVGALVLAAVLGGAASWALGWTSPAETQEARLMRAMDRVLTARAVQLPPEVRKDLDALYTQYGFVALSSRKGK